MTAMRKIFFLCLVFIFTASSGQDKKQDQPVEYMKKNNFYVLYNIHYEKRGTEKYVASNPDIGISYERDLAGFGDHHFFMGIRTGAYKEYVLTGDGWAHPEKYRFFLGLSPSYMMYFSRNFRFQVNFIYDVLFPDDYDEIWSYWAAEVSYQYFIKDFYLGISATRGVFLFFDPKAHMAKVGIKLGYRW